MVLNSVKNQSFIACIADIMFYIDSKNIPTIKEMKEMILSSLSIDDFLTYQNGNLYVDFDIEPTVVTDELLEKIHGFQNLSSNSI